MINKIKSIIRDQYRFQIQLSQEAHVNRTIAQKQLVGFFRNNKIELKETVLDFSVYSESNEDAILLYLLSFLKTKGTLNIIDIGGGRGFKGSNTANLFLHHSANGVIFEGDKNNYKSLRNEYEKLNSPLKPNLINQYVSAENINGLIEQNLRLDGETHVLSLDIDSIDFWIWNALSVVQPQIVVVEYQCILKADESLVVPENFSNPTFVERNNRRYAIHNSASLKAFEKLADKKGYRLVATSTLGFNAFFVKKELPLDHINTISVEEGLDRDFVKWAQKEFYADTKKLEWIDY